MRLIIPTILLLLVSWGTAQADDPFFDGLAGNWRGAGFIKLAANAQEENIRCRLSTTNNPNGKELFVIGSCALAGFVLPINGSIVADGNATYSSTVFRTLVRLTTNSFSGRRRGASLYLHFEGRDAGTRQVIKARLVIQKHGKRGFAISVSNTDPQTGTFFKVGTIDFRAG